MLPIVKLLYNKIIMFMIMKLPCESIIWDILPSIRKEFALNLINEYGLSEKETAKKIKITTSAVSQYISGKRASIKINDKEILKEIHKSSKNILMNNGENIVFETCRICTLLRGKSCHLNQIQNNQSYKPLCEDRIWNVLPIIRKTLAEILIKDYGFSQRKAALKLGLSPAAVSRYISGKRGLSSSNGLNDYDFTMFKKSLDKIVNYDNKTLIQKEICKICENLYPNHILRNE